MPTSDADVSALLERVDPLTVVILLVLVIYIITKNKEALKKGFDTYLTGRLHEKKEEEHEEGPEAPSTSDLLIEIRNELVRIRENQDLIMHGQTELKMEISTMKEVVNNRFSDISETMNSVSDRCDFLMTSDKEDKKSFITREYNYFFIRLQKIDLYSKETIEKIYELYLKENGDTFVKGMMTSIRSLPVVPQITSEDVYRPLTEERTSTK